MANTKKRADLAILAAVLALAGCGDLPRDPEGTTRSIRETGELRLGMSAGVPPQREAEEVLQRAADLLGAKIVRTQAPSEDLFARLERGELDLVYGSFAANSPWKQRVYLGHPPAWRVDPPKDVEAPRFAYRRGENGWIMSMERMIR